jgi:hypothetical protein
VASSAFLSLHTFLPFWSTREDDSRVRRAPEKGYAPA